MLALVPMAHSAVGADAIAKAGGIEALVALSRAASYDAEAAHAVRAALRAIGATESLRMRLLAAANAADGRVAERSSE